jgi:hypothetical protein
MDMRFGTWNVSCLHRSSALNTARESGKNKLVDVQEVRPEKGGN